MTGKSTGKYEQKVADDAMIFDEQRECVRQYETLQGHTGTYEKTREDRSLKRSMPLALQKNHFRQSGTLCSLPVQFRADVLATVHGL